MFVHLEMCEDNGGNYVRQPFSLGSEGGLVCDLLVD